MPPAVDPGCRFSVDRLSPKMARWELAPTGTPIGWELDTDRVRHGRASARLVVPSVSEGGVSADDTWKGRGWPAIHLTGEKLPVRDWSPYRHLVFETFNPAERPVNLWIRLGDHPGLEQVVLQQGWQNLRVDLDHVFTLDELRFFFADPPREINLDHIRIETGDLGDVRRSRPRCRAHPRHRGGAADPPRPRQPARDRRGARQALGAMAARSPRTGTKRLPGAGRDRCGGSEAGWRGSLFAPGRTGSPSLGVWLDPRHDLPRFPGAAVSPARSAAPCGSSWRPTRACSSFCATPRSPPPTGRPRRRDLDGPDGNRIESGQVEVLPVGYVNTRPPPYDVEHQGWWPDPLLDFLDGFELDAHVWQPVWLDVRTAPDQAPGLYSGTITVTAGSRGGQGGLPPPRGALRGRGLGFRRSGGAPLSPVPPTGRRRPGVSTSRIAPTWRRC